MAWYSLYKWFIPWRKIKYTNQISLYKRFLYDEWYNSLSEEDKQRLEEIRLKRKKEGEQALENLGRLFNTINYATNGRMMDYMRIASDMKKFGLR